MKRRLLNLKPDLLAAETAAWFRARIDPSPLVAVAATKTVPIHTHSWIYLLGGAALFLFTLQIASGALLMLYYQPTDGTAHESLERIMTEVPYGWLIRSVHVWGAHVMIGTVCLHFLTVLFTRAYRKPRELTWVSGVLMLFLALGFGFSGYLLPWNELSYYATLVGTQIPGTVPGVGGFLVHFLRGGEQVTGDTITRFFAVHVQILPLTFGALLLVHLVLVQFQGISLPLGMTNSQVKDHRPFFAEFMLIDGCIWLLLFGLVVTLSVFQPAEIGVKADPLRPAPEGIRPEWYFLFMFQTLKYVPETAGVMFFALGVLFLVALPFLDRNAMREKRSPGFTAIFCVLLAYALVFEILAIYTPGVDHPREQLAAATYSVSSSVVSLALVWIVIGFLIFYLRQLVKANTCIRTLYQSDVTRAS